VRDITSPPGNDITAAPMPWRARQRDGPGGNGHVLRYLTGTPNAVQRTNARLGILDKFQFSRA